MASAESPSPEPTLYVPALLIALAILVCVVLALAALHFILKKLRRRNPQARPGVDQRILALLPVQTYNKNFKFLPSGYNECSVCLSGIEEGMKIRILPNCCHVFHVQCIDEWLSSHSNCPLCRSEIVAGSPLTPDEVSHLV